MQGVQFSKHLSLKTVTVALSYLYPSLPLAPVRVKYEDSQDLAARLYSTIDIISTICPVFTEKIIKLFAQEFLAFGSPLFHLLDVLEWHVAVNDRGESSTLV